MSSMHMTQPQLQRVSQWNWSFACKEAVLPACFFLGSSLVAQFHKASVKFLRTTSLACIRLNRNYNESVKWNGSFACKEAVHPACFVFPRASACLILACLSTVKGRPAPFHTLAQKYLIELLLWSASGVHKQSPKIWQAKVGWQGRKTSVEEFFLCPC